MRLSPHFIRHVHFVGVGGIGMSGIAEILHNLGYYVTGSDVSEGANVIRLQEQGIKIFIGHHTDNIQGAQVVVTSTAVSKLNPEVLAAKAQGIAVIQRAEMLGELMRLKVAVAIAGTHGKTTTTSLMAALFDEAELNPTVVNGGILNAYNTNAKLGDGEWIVVEADESDGSFIKLFPTFGIVTNIDADHLDFYKDFDDIRDAFLKFIDRIPFYGAAIVCNDHPEIRNILPLISGKRIITYGLEAGAQIRAINIKPAKDGTEFDVEITPPVFQPQLISQCLMPRTIRDLYLPMVGIHNIQNALAIVAMAQELQLNDQILSKALRDFKGVKRRFTKVAEINGITIIDDYAHHPVEIKTTLSAAKQASAKRVIVVLQPHRFTRVAALMDDFATCLKGADQVILLPLYAAGEEPLVGISSETLAHKMEQNGIHVLALKHNDELPQTLFELAKKGDYVVCMGAGTITYLASKLPTQLEELSFAHENGSYKQKTQRKC